MAAESNGRFSVEQIEDALRMSGNDALKESPQTGFLVDINQSNEIYDVENAKWLLVSSPDGKSKYLMQQLPSKISPSLADFISQNTGGKYSPYSWSNGQKGQLDPKEPYIPYLAVIPDYLAIGGGGLGLYGSIAINTHTGQVYAGGSGSASVIPSGNFVAGWIPNNAGESREVVSRNTMNFLTGAGVDLSICSFLCVGASHAYGGDTALELGGGIKLPIKGLSGSSGVMTPVFHLPFTTGDRVINKNGTQ